VSFDAGSPARLQVQGLPAVGTAACGFKVVGRIWQPLLPGRLFARTSTAFSATGQQQPPFARRFVAFRAQLGESYAALDATLALAAGLEAV
jgi:hypothetical protein